MSRRPNPGAERAAQNTQTLKTLVKLEYNKSCADCKRNKHPRWASWNLGIFVCIRCSGIHRGMGTHISRVKSVDLDSWTDEQLQSMLKWGNARANKYWEAKLAPGHVPSESKMENFIRTKYESKRWVMEGGIPDPSTLDVEGDDDIPLNVVQEKAKLEKSSSQRTAPSSGTIAKPPPPGRNIDFFGDDSILAPPRPSTTGPIVPRAPPPKAEPAPPKQTKPGDSLLGLDFFGGTQSTPPRPASTTPASASASGPSRPDLKQSILSLYASAPKPSAQAQHGRSDSYGQQNPAMSQQSNSSFGGLNDAFSGLSFASPPVQQQPKPSAFSGLASVTPKSTSTQGNTMSSFASGGSFFDLGPKPMPAQAPVPQPPQPQRTFSSSSGFGDFASMTAPAPAPAPAPVPAASPPPPPKPVAQSGMGDLFDLSIPSIPTATSAPAPKPQNYSSFSADTSSAFNLSSRPPVSYSAAPPQPSPKAPATSTFSSYNSALHDPWGSNDAWGAPSTANTKPAPPAAPQSTAMGSMTPNWGNSPEIKQGPPQVSADEDFGGWSSAPPKPQGSATPAKPIGGMGGGDDLFSNVWE